MPLDLWIFSFKSRIVVSASTFTVQISCPESARTTEISRTVSASTSDSAAASAIKGSANRRAKKAPE